MVLVFPNLKKMVFPKCHFRVKDSEVDFLFIFPVIGRAQVK